MDSTVNSLKIELLNGRAPVYYPGSAIEGNVVIELTEPLRPIQSMKIMLIGRGHTSWEERRKIGRYVYTLTFTEDEVILGNVHTEIWIQGNYTTVAGAPQQVVGLPAGKHKLPFKICLAPNLALPSSLEEPFGYIRYMLKAGISTSELRKFEYIALKQISINSLTDVNLPSFVLPLTKSNEKTVCCCCCASGPIAMTVTTDRGAYCSGESIAITVITENFSNRRIEYVQADLKRTIHFHGKPTYRGRAIDNVDDSTNYITNIIQTIRGTADWHNKLLPIPVTVPTVFDTQIIQVFYTLDVFLYIRNALNLHTIIPIVIGSIPYKGPSAGTRIQCYMRNYN